MNINIYKTSILSVLLMTLLIGSCQEKHEVIMAEDTRPTVSVKLSQAGTSAHQEYNRVSGKIQAENSINVSSRLMGALTNVNVDVGDKVYAGQVLANISNNDIRAKVAQSEAGILEAKTSLGNIEKDYNRIKNLFGKQSATQKELDDISTRRDMMKARLKQAQEVKNEINTMMSYSTVQAPFGGVITAKYINNGDLAAPGKPLFNLETGNNFQAEAMIPEQLISNINKGDDVTVILKSNNTEVRGKIVEKSLSSINTGGQYLIKINLDKRDIKGINIYSGMYINVLLPIKADTHQASKILVNNDLIIRQGQLTGLYTVSNQKTALLRWVRLGRIYGDKVEITSGLTTGESYISEHQGRLLNGVKIQLD